MSITIEIDIETASRNPQGWAPWVGSPGLNPIPRVVWNYVNPCGGAIMARMGFRHSKAVKRQTKAQK